MTAHVGGRLTVSKVRSAGTGKHPDGANLWLQVGPSGSKSWYLRYTLRGRTREMGLGPFPLVSLSEAREKAAVQRRLLLDGLDPIEARRARQRPKREAITFAAAVEQFIKNHEAAWSKDHDRQWRSSLARYVLPAIGGGQSNSIDTYDVLSIVEPLWQGRTETGTRVLNRIAQILDWATARKLRAGPNPAAWRGNIDAILPTRSKVQKTVRHPALPYQQLPSFMAKLRQQSGQGACAAELMLLTACRTGEVRFAAWSEIDLDAGLWTIPALRMKAERDHRIPVVRSTASILAALPRDGDRVFPGLGQHAILKALQRVEPEVTGHGFRSCFRDWVAECTSFPSEVAELALAHSVGSKIEQAYRRSDLLQRRRELMEAWGAYCDGAGGADVLPLRTGTEIR